MENNASLYDYNKKYGFLSIVYVMAGDEKIHYIAKKDVPRHTKITDTNYWKNIDLDVNAPDYSDITGKPKINGVEVEGELTSQDLGVYSKPSTGIPQSDLAPEVQSQLNKHFKGWYDSEDNLPDNPMVGDYAYVKGATSSDPAAIYECATAGTWSDSERDVDTSSVQTFETTEQVNEVSIINDLVTGGEHDVLSAEQGKNLKSITEKTDTVVNDGLVKTIGTINFDFTRNGYIGFSNGLFIASDNAKCTSIIPLDKVAKIHYQTRIGSAGCELAFFDQNKAYLSNLSIAGNSTLNSNTIILDSGYSDAKYVICSVYGTASISYAYLKLEYENENSIEKQVITCKDDIEYIRADDKLDLTDFSNKAYITTDGRVSSTNEDYRCTDLIPLNGAKTIKLYGVYVGSSSCILCFYDKNGTKVGNTYNSINATTTEYVVNDIPSNAVNFRCGSRYSDLSVNTYVKYGDIVERVDYLLHKAEKDVFDTILISQTQSKPKVLIFGDSITDCANFTIDTVLNRTAAYSMRHPSNSYTNSQGQLVSYDKWPYFVKTILNSTDLRNYAYSGASYRSLVRESGNERQNLEYQMQLAINDLTNPNSVFPTIGTYIPDIVIFALGTNDGNPTSSETYDSAMAKTVMDGSNFDVDATIAALDWTNRADAVRKAFLLTKKHFPYALTFVVLPIPRVDREISGDGTMNDLIAKFARRYSIHIIDGAEEMGIVRDFCGNIDIYLKDGLHPNDKGQNLYARLVLSAIRKEYIDMSVLNP